MSKRTRRNHSPAFKAKVALAAMKDDKTIAEIAQQCEVHPTQVSEWRRQLLDRVAEVFGTGTAPTAAPVVDMRALHAKIGQQALEIGFFKRRAHQGGTAERKQMIDRDHKLPVKRQAQLLDVSRGTAYYQPWPVSQRDLALMRSIDELHLEHSFAGSRLLRDLLRREGHQVGRLHVGTLMARTGIKALYKKPNTSRKHPRYPVYPYLLRGLKIERANQVWAMDITYIPMARGFVYLAAVLDWHSRRVLAHRVSITMEADFCVAALEEGIARYGKPEIMNTDQGSQFTGMEFTDTLRRHGIAISMDGRGCWRDNVFVERLWKTIKYEDIYLKAYETVSAMRVGIASYIDFYNTRRPHTAHGGRTPEEAYYATLPTSRLAA
ncbi:MAG: IS3 family transposase [Acidobacteriaceae bacterium]